jgi:hypothetical protein
MAEMIDNLAPTVWLLVKVPRVIDVGSGEDRTAMSLRVSVQSHHFGGEKAAVRRLTRKEILAIKSASSPARGISSDELGGDE